MSKPFDLPIFDLYARPCPTCRARPGEPCTQDGFQIARLTHVDRRVYQVRERPKEKEREG
jgi:hypothetical protein